MLDMQVTIISGSFKTKVYNKTDSFPFEVVSMPFIESNIAEKICYKVFYSQVLRYQRLCSFLEDFITRVNLLGNFLLRRGYRLDRLAREFRQVLGNYRSEFERWSIPTDSQIWFHNILNNTLSNNLPNRSLPLTGIQSFSQPLSENIGPRFNTYSQ